MPLCSTTYSYCNCNSKCYSLGVSLWIQIPQTLMSAGIVNDNNRRLKGNYKQTYDVLYWRHAQTRDYLIWTLRYPYDKVYVATQGFQKFFSWIEFLIIKKQWLTLHNLYGSVFMLSQQYEMRCGIWRNGEYGLSFHLFIWIFV